MICATLYRLKKAPAETAGDPQGLFTDDYRSVYTGDTFAGLRGLFEQLRVPLYAEVTAETLRGAVVTGLINALDPNGFALPDPTGGEQWFNWSALLTVNDATIRPPSKQKEAQQ